MDIIQLEQLAQQLTQKNEALQLQVELILKLNKLQLEKIKTMEEHFAKLGEYLDGGGTIFNGDAIHKSINYVLSMKEGESNGK